MLYDPKWEVEVKADPYKLESLIAWLEKQPADGTFNFCDASKCMLAQWLRTIDPTSVLDEALNKHSYWYVVGGKSINFEHFSRIAIAENFGVALARARKALVA